MAKKITKKENHKKQPKTEKIKKRYFRTFYCSFCASFILFGLIAVLIFVYSNDKRFFGFSRRHYEKAEEYMAAEDYEKAEKEYLESLKKDPEYSTARIALSDLYITTGHYDKASDILKTGIELHPRNQEFYILYIKALVKQNRVKEANDFINSISSSYITIKLAAVRPSNFVSSPDPGIYDAAISVTLNVPEGCEVYYTLDGSDPTTETGKYMGDPIVISSGTANLRAFAINQAGLISDEYSATYRIYNSNSPYLFKDEKTEQIVRSMIGKPTGNILYGDLEDIGVFSNEISGQTFSGAMTTLEDLAAKPKQKGITIKNETGITDFSPLLTMKNLTDLELSGCAITDDAVKNSLTSLIWLKNLTLNDNQITTLTSFSGMNKLSALSLNRNAIKTLDGISGFTGLTKFSVSGNGLGDIADLSDLTALREIDLSDNIINDISPLAVLQTVSDLNLSANSISSAEPLKNLSRCKTINLSGNTGLSSIDFAASCQSLMNLNISDTGVANLAPLSALSSLANLNFSKTKVTDLSPILSLPLKSLYAAGLSIGDQGLSVVCSVPTLETLDLSDNGITDVSAIIKLKYLKVLNISGNTASNISVLTGCSSLETVSCARTGITRNDMANLGKFNITAITD